LISERKKYKKLTDYIYSRYTLKHELNFTVKACILTLFFCIFMVTGYIYLFLKNYGFSIRNFLDRVPIIFIVAVAVFTAVLLCALIGNLLYLKFGCDAEEESILFDNYLRNEFKMLYSKGKVEKYEIFRFYLFDSLELYDLNADDFEDGLDNGTSKSQPKTNKQTKNKNSTKSNNKGNNSKSNLRAMNSRTNVKNRDRSRR